MSGKNVVKLTHTGSFCPSLNCTWGRERERERERESIFLTSRATLGTFWLILTATGLWPQHTHTRGMRQVKDETFLLTESSILSLSLSLSLQHTNRQGSSAWGVTLLRFNMNTWAREGPGRERKRERDSNHNSEKHTEMTTSEVLMVKH